jgi:tetratricopeptide (TPR) repeat protein
MFLDRRWRVGLAVLGFFLLLLVRHRLGQMDGVWFQLSLHGARALVLYGANDLEGAAKAYWQHFANADFGKRVWTDPALDALARGARDRARSLATTAAAERPRDVGAQLTLAEVALASGAPAEALAAGERALALDEERFDALLLSALAHARLDRPGAAIDLMNRGLRTGRVGRRTTTFLLALETTGWLAERPANARPLCLLAHLHRYLRIYDDANGRTALAYARQAIAAGDRPADGHFSIGMVRARQDRKDEALQEFQAAIRIDPSHALSLREASNVYRQRGDLWNAYLLTKAAFDATPSDFFYAEYHYELLINELGNYPEAAAVAARMAQIRPDAAQGPARLGRVHALMGDHAAAERFWRQALLARPGDPETLVGLGLALRYLGREREAEDRFRQALAVSSGFQARRELGLLYYWQARYAEAAAELRTAIRLGAADRDTIGMLCLTYEAAREFARSTQCFRRMAFAFPGVVLPLPSLPEVLNNVYMAERG